MSIYSDCQKCILSTRRKNLVLWRTNYGDGPADVLFIGEAPGKSEDALGEPFVGRAGRFLDQLLHMAGLDDSRLKLKIAWTNVLACRPCDYIGGPNRIPTCHEISMCRERLATTLAIFNPKVVVLLGKTAQQNWEATRDYGNFVWSGKVVALPHPARLLRAGGLASPDVQDYVTELKTLPRLIKEES